MNTSERSKRWARRLETEVYALYLAYKDPRVPWYARLFAACVAGYAFSPVDLIPNFIPVLGRLDDLVLVSLSVALAVRMIPRRYLLAGKASPICYDSSIRARRRRDCGVYRAVECRGGNKRGFREMGKSRVGDPEGGISNKVKLIVGAIVVAFVLGFVALIFIDQGAQPGDPPEGVETFDMSGAVNNHTEEDVEYAQTPPAGGEHNPRWQNSGFYDEPIRNETAVHTMEHGAVWITYSPDLPQDQQEQLREIVSGQDCLLASPFPNLPGGAPLMASAWGAQITLTGVDDPNLDSFIQAYRRGPQTPEPGAACTRGVGEPVSA